MAVAILTGCSHTPPPPVSIKVPLATGAQVSPASPITVEADGGTLTNVVVTNTTANGQAVPGEFDKARRAWQSTADPAYASTYHVVATAKNSANETRTQSFDITTITPTDTAYANVVPAPDLVAENGIGVGQPMVFQFTHPVTNKKDVEKHLHITVSPPQPGGWYWVDDSNVHYRAPQYWKPGTKIHIEADVYGVDLGDGVYAAENNSADYTVHDSWVAKADGSTELLTVFHNGTQIRQMPMSLGSPDYPSHLGPHVVSERAYSVVMDSCTYGVCKGDPNYYRETVFYDLRISNDGEFVHAAPWSVGSQGSSNVSHGCVNLSTDDAQWMYNNFDVGDVVEITNSGGEDLPVWDTYGDWDVPWSTWAAGNATS
ncbi:MAG: Ig-like domain-containing protein [Nocardiaceae bacterium]|nr:Ig-like domain-containing protein [Nocardiaceae bacterium]